MGLKLGRSPHGGAEKLTLFRKMHNRKIYKWGCGVGKEKGKRGRGRQKGGAKYQQVGQLT